MKEPVIEFSNFGFHYKSQADKTLYDINLTIYKGEKVLIAGPSGSGKSTIGHCLNGLAPFAYEGEITGSLKVLGTETRDLSVSKLSKMIGTVLQDSDGQFIGLTVAEDMAFALENDCVPLDEMKERVAEVAELVDIKNHLGLAPQELSGGQKQRVAMGGVIIDQVDIMIFDEPLANLDPATGKRTMEYIDKLQKQSGTTVIIIEHRLEDVLHAPVDRIIIMDQGRIVKDGTPNEILAEGILSQKGIREPLYLTALRYAGVNFSASDCPEDLMKLKADFAKVKDWFAATEAQKHRPDLGVVLEVQNIDFGYRKDHQILKDISFSIKKGEMVSLVGTNGAGKTTISKVICGFVKPNKGKIYFDGKDITNSTIKERAENIGIVMQNPNQMISKHMIFDEVALGLVIRGEKNIKEKVEQTLKICGLYEFRNWPIAALSFGQKRRVTIASILVLDPKIIILDEPTAGQDYRHYTEIMEFLKTLNGQGITIIMITHDMHLMLEYTTRSVVLSGGQKIFDGSPAEVLTNPQIIERASLKETSLYHLAQKAGIEPAAFAQRFIDYERGKLHG